MMAIVDLRVVFDPAPVRRKVATNLREAILQGHFAPGEKLKERELLEMTGVSRSSVREALRELENEGFVVMTPSRGVVVMSVSEEEALEIYEVRIALEGLAARLFAKHATKEQGAALQSALGEIEAARDDAMNLRRYRNAKSTFYEILFQGAANQTAAKALRTYHQKLQLLWGKPPASSEEKENRKKEMREIVRALRNRDADRAYKATEAHLRNSIADLLKASKAISSDAARK